MHLTDEDSLAPKARLTLPAGQRDARCLMYSPSGRYLAVGCNDGQIMFFVANSDSPVAAVKPHDAPVWDVSFAPTEFGTVIASCGSDKKLVIMKECANAWQIIFEDTSASSILRSVHFCRSPCAPLSSFQSNAVAGPVGLHLACASLDGSVGIYSLATDNEWRKTVIKAHNGGAYVCRWSGTEIRTENDLSDPGYRLATGGFDGTVAIWSYNNAMFNLEDRLCGHTRGVIDLAWMPPVDNCEERIASLSEDGVVILWAKPHRKSWVKQQSFKTGMGSHRLAYSFDGSTIAVSMRDGNPPVKLIKMW